MVSAHIQEHIVGMLVTLVENENCCGAGDLAGAQSGAR